MKKILFISILFFLTPFFLGAQEGSQNYSLIYDGFTTISDEFVVSDEEKHVKVGSAVANEISAGAFFGQTNFQLGIGGSYLSGSFLAKKFEAREFKEMKIGPKVRYSCFNSEVKLGINYFNRSVEKKGFLIDSAGYYVGQLEESFNKEGLEIPLDLILSQTRFKLFPKVELSAKQKLVLTEIPGGLLSRLDKGPLEFSGEVFLYRIDLFPEVYFSPIAGVESRGLFVRGPVYKVGVGLASNLARADIIKVGYFFDQQKTGIDGFFMSVDLLGVIAK